MGASCSRTRPNDTESGLIHGNDASYHGDQSYRYYEERASYLIYDNEFSPEKPKVQLRVKEEKTESKKSVKEKLENIRQSWFNPERFDQEEFYHPEKKDIESKATVKDKISTWRRSWFGPADSAPAFERKISVADTNMMTDESKDLGNSVVYRDSRNKLSKSGINRLSVTRSFVQRLGQADEVYGKTSKSGTPRSPSGARKGSKADIKDETSFAVETASTAAKATSHEDDNHLEADIEMEAKEPELSFTADALVEMEEAESTNSKAEEKEDISDDEYKEETNTRIHVAPPTVSLDIPEVEENSQEECENEAEPTETKTSTVRVTTVVTTPRYDRPRVFSGASRYSAVRPTDKQEKADSDDEECKSNDYKKLDNDSSDCDSD